MRMTEKMAKNKDEQQRTNKKKHISQVSSFAHIKIIIKKNCFQVSNK